MPIYEYRCLSCGKQFEKLMGFSDPNVNSPECPDCQSKNTQKRVSTISAFGNRDSSESTSSNCGSSGGFR